MARGGSRPGAGRKPRSKTGIVLIHPSIPPASALLGPPADLPVPACLDPEERAVWLERAPHAIAFGTLDAASVPTFVRYCQHVVLEQHESKSSGRGGPNHRGILKLLNDLELRYMTSPNGRPMPQRAGAVETLPASKLGRFR
jgi:hypothetical protein